MPSSTSASGSRTGSRTSPPRRASGAKLTLTVEQGIIGGVPAGGMDAGAGVNYDMMADQPYQFDFYDGGGLDLAFLSFAEVDREGNVNVSRYGTLDQRPGRLHQHQPGRPQGGVLRHAHDRRPGGRAGRRGRPRRCGRRAAPRSGSPQVQQLTFNGRYARERGQEVMYVTERAVFRLGRATASSWSRSRRASISRRDVLERIGFPVRVAEPLRRWTRACSGPSR